MLEGFSFFRITFTKQTMNKRFFSSLLLLLSPALHAETNFAQQTIDLGLVVTDLEKSLEFFGQGILLSLLIPPLSSTAIIALII